MGVHVLTFKDKPVSEARARKAAKCSADGFEQKALIAGATAKYVKEAAVDLVHANDWRELSKQGFAVEQVA